MGTAMLIRKLGRTPLSFDWNAVWSTVRARGIVYRPVYIYRLVLVNCRVLGGSWQITV